LLARVLRLASQKFKENLAFAKEQEELDRVANEKFEDRIVLTGISIDKFSKLSKSDKMSKMKRAVKQILGLFASPDWKPEVTLVDLVNKSVKDGPLVINARLSSAEEVKIFYAKYVKARRKWARAGSVPEELRGVLVHVPVLTVATRVRIDILRSLAGLIREESGGEVRSSVIANLPRPVLQLKTYSVVTHTLGFTEAIEHVKENYDGSLSKLRLDRAYKRAGSSFGGDLKKYFVVLKND